MAQASVTHVKASQPYLFQENVSLDVASVAADTLVEQTFTVNGLTTDMVPIVIKQTDDAGLALLHARVSAADTLALLFYNHSGGAVDPAAQNFKVIVL
jgi:hypothetical protein